MWLEGDIQICTLSNKVIARRFEPNTVFCQKATIWFKTNIVFGISVKN